MAGAGRRRTLPTNLFADRPLSEWLKTLSSATRAEDRLRAFQAVTQLAPPAETLPQALALLRDADAELRGAAARWLSTAAAAKTPPDGWAAQRSAVVDALRQALADADPDVQLEAARGLVRLDPDDARLVDVAADLSAREETGSTTVAHVVDLCGRLPRGVERTAGFLQQALAAESAEVREAAAAAWARLGTHAHVAVPQLMVALEDEEPLVREFAARALGGAGVRSDDVAHALEAATRDEDRVVAEVAQAALRQLSGNG